MSEFNLFLDKLQFKTDVTSENTLHQNLNLINHTNDQV